MSTPRALRTYRGSVRNIWTRQGTFLDALVVMVAVAAEVEIVVGDFAGPRWLLVSAVPLYTLPLLLRARWPFLAPVLAIGIQVATSFLDVPGGERETWGVVAYILAFWVLAAHNPPPRAIAGLAIALAGVVAVTVEDSRVVAAESSSVALVGVLVWVAGVAIRQRTVRVEDAERRAAALEQEHVDATAAVTQERARIARELHDVVAHSVSVMTVQAGAARMMLGGDPQRALAPLLAVEETGRQALGELRRLLGILREDPDDHGLGPQPGIDDLKALVETVRDTGLPVELVVDGTVRPLAPGLGLAAYRIVQEALTNTLKHAGAHRVVVTVGYAERLTIEVCDDGVGRPGGPGGRPGHGVAGMRERAQIYGGALTAGPEPGGGYAVRATLPFEGTSP